MDQTKIDMFIMTNHKYLPMEKIIFIKERMKTIDGDKEMLLSTIDFKDPTTILLISIFVGSLGIDRFMIGNIGMGILKLLTVGLCGILTIIDWFIISKKVKKINFNNLMLIL